MWGVVALVRAISVFTSDPVPQSVRNPSVGTVDASSYIKGGQVTADGLLTDNTAIEIPVCLGKGHRQITATASDASVGSPLYVSVTLRNRIGRLLDVLSDTRAGVHRRRTRSHGSARCAAVDGREDLLLRPAGTWSVG